MNIWYLNDKNNTYDSFFNIQWYGKAIVTICEIKIYLVGFKFNIFFHDGLVAHQLLKNFLA